MAGGASLRREFASIPVGGDGVVVVVVNQVANPERENETGWSALLSPQITRIEEDFTEKMSVFYQAFDSFKG